MITLSRFRILCALILSYLALSISPCRATSILQDLSEVSSRFLFGQIWDYGEYCGDRRKPADWVREDNEAGHFYDAADSLLNENQTVDVDQLMYQGIRARHFTSLTCAINSWGYSDQETLVASDSPKYDESKCLSSIDDLHSLVVNESARKNEEHGRLWHQLNCFGRVPPGLVHQSHQWIGDYSECVLDDDSRYCFAAYRMNKWPSDPVAYGIYLRIGMCLPKTCNQNLYNRKVYLDKLDQIVKSNLISGPTPIDLRKYHLAGMYCPPTLDSRYMNLFKDATSIILGTVAGVWLLTMAYATLLRPQRELGTLKGFDLRLVCGNFFQTTTANSKSETQLLGLNFFKVACFFWILCSHYIMLAMSYVFNIQDIRRIWNPSFFGTFIFQGQHAVPLFFIVSGLLVGFKYIKEDSNKNIKYQSFVWQRYLRLAPLYLVVYAYVRKFAHLLESGPLWDYGVSPQSEAHQCQQESWLVPLLMLANFLHPFSHCILTGWHIANDFQIYLILPLFIWLYRRSPRLGHWLAIISFLSSHLFHFYNFHRSQNYSFELLVKETYLFGSRYMMDRLVVDYVNPLGRFGTIVIGLFLASLLKSDNFCRKYSTRKIRLMMIVLGLAIEVASVMARFEIALGELIFGPYIKSVAYPFTRLTVELGWFLLLLGTLLSNYNKPQTTLGECAYTAQNGTTYHLRLELADTQLEKTEETALESVAGPSFYKWPVWDILVRLNYSLMLIHYSVFRHLIQSSQTQALHFSLLALFQNGSFVILMSYLASFVLHIMVEVPLNSLIKQLTNR